MTPLEVELAINGLIVLINVLVTNVKSGDKLTEEQKAIFLTRLSNMQNLVNNSKFPV